MPISSINKGFCISLPNITNVTQNKILLDQAKTSSSIMYFYHQKLIIKDFMFLICFKSSSPRHTFHIHTDFLGGKIGNLENFAGIWCWNLIIKFSHDKDALACFLIFDKCLCAVVNKLSVSVQSSFIKSASSHNRLNLGLINL